MKHQYTYTFFNVNKTVFEFFRVSHLTEEMVKKWKTYKGLYTAATGVLKNSLVLYNMHNWAIN